MTDMPRDRAIMRKALHPLLESARSRLRLLERDERRCGANESLKTAEIRGERRAWENIRSDIQTRIIRLKDDQEEML